MLKILEADCLKTLRIDILTQGRNHFGEEVMRYKIPSLQRGCDVGSTMYVMVPVHARAIGNDISVQPKKRSHRTCSSRLL